MNSSPIEADLDLPICATCGAQFDELPSVCSICLDDRQWVPIGGSIWTSLRQLRDSGRTIVFKEDAVDPDMTWLVTSPPLAIAQSPLLVKTPSGWLMIECCPFVSAEAVAEVSKRVADSGLPFLGIALSHPHWYNSGTVWARALGCKIYASALDKEWWVRRSSVDEVVEWWDGPTKKLGEHATMVLCGGSCVTHVERPTRGGFLACADTIMIGWSSRVRSVSFMYSYPNHIPLAPPAILTIWNAVRGYSFEDAYGAWPERRLVGGARDTVLQGVKKMIVDEGHKIEAFQVEE
ncbi:hypothetical protein RQP46_010455 [Phenoliferia psychrophenolica]